MEAKGENRVRVEAGQKSTQEKGVSGSEEAGWQRVETRKRQGESAMEEGREKEGEGWLKDSGGKGRWAWAEG